MTYGQTFTVGTSDPDQVGQVNWVRLSSVTHSFNTNQRINFLKFTADATTLKVTAPANANLCPARPLHALRPQQERRPVRRQDDQESIESRNDPSDRPGLRTRHAPEEHH